MPGQVGHKVLKTNGPVHLFNKQYTITMHSFKKQQLQVFGSFGAAWEEYLERFWMVFVIPGGVRRENCDKPEFDDLLNEIAILLRAKCSKS